MVSVQEQQQALWQRYLAGDRRSLGKPKTADPQAKAIEDALFATYWKLVQWLARKFVGPDRGPKQRKTAIDFDDAVSYAAETWIQAMRTWQPGAAKFTSFARLCVRRQLWKREDRRANHQPGLGAELARVKQNCTSILLELATSAPFGSEEDLPATRKALGLRAPRPKRARRKAGAGADRGETAGEESTVAS